MLTKALCVKEYLKNILVVMDVAWAVRGSAMHIIWFPLGISQKECYVQKKIQLLDNNAPSITMGLIVATGKSPKC